MPVVSPKTRVVYFRLSHGEFQKLSSLCQDLEGARSVSELSRSAVQKLILKNENGYDGGLASLKNLNRMIAELGEQIEQLLLQIRDRSANSSDAELPSSATQAETVQDDAGKAEVCN